MSTNVLTIKPDLSFGFDHPFEVPDQFNGRKRGTWYYRSKWDGEVKGPFLSELHCLLTMSKESECPPPLSL